MYTSQIYNILSWKVTEIRVNLKCFYVLGKKSLESSTIVVFRTSTETVQLKLVLILSLYCMHMPGIGTMLENLCAPLSTHLHHSYTKT